MLEWFQDMLACLRHLVDLKICCNRYMKELQQPKGPVYLFFSVWGCLFLFLSVLLSSSFDALTIPSLFLRSLTCTFQLPLI